MIRSTEEILALSGEAAVAMEEGRAVYANAPARALLGKDVVGRSAEELIGASLPLGGQPFVYGELRLNGAPYAARLGRVGDGFAARLCRRTYRERQPPCQGGRGSQSFAASTL